MSVCPTCGHNPRAELDHQPAPVAWLREWAARTDNQLTADTDKLRRAINHAADLLGSQQAHIAALKTQLIETHRENAA